MQNIRLCSHAKNLNLAASVRNHIGLKHFIGGINCQHRSASKGPPCDCKPLPPTPKSAQTCPDQKAPDCCEDEEWLKYQMRGKNRMEHFPKQDEPPCNYPSWFQTPQPPNYDPYRIKTPDVYVPPLPKSNAKEMPGEYVRAQRLPNNAVMGAITELFHSSAIVHPDYWKDQEKRKVAEVPAVEVLPRLGYHGKAKYKFAFHEPWRPLDRLALLEEAEEDTSEEMEAIEKAEETKTPHGL